MTSRWPVRRAIRRAATAGTSGAGRWGRATRRTVVAAVAVPALLLVACDTDDGLAPAPLEEPAPDPEDTAPPEDATSAEEDNAATDQDDAGSAIDPGSTLGPGKVTTVVGELAIAFDLPDAVEGGTVAPGGVPPALELLSEGGAIVVFEALGHATADGDDPLVAAGLPDDLGGWLTDDLPGEVRPVDPPEVLDDGVAAVLQNDGSERTWPLVLWEFDDAAAPEELEGHGPPPGQTQHLWLRQLDDGWVGVVTYGPNVDVDLAEAVALSLRAG